MVLHLFHAATVLVKTTKSYMSDFIADSVFNIIYFAGGISGLVAGFYLLISFAYYFQSFSYMKYKIMVANIDDIEEE